ncbi:enoyl-CoA hydratase [Marinicauda salina]|uniref:Enoyl-CoA hydratase n=1 Tax=Marinicauda salina TaxID=2135793 RepID=A0A2U2BRT5_9PROT|nr:enoyl-CoA hydratase-related protein [Marinicauda salina]PWE16706.1 enoyl-CoA hydratase [Marinicauda salina]
MSDFATIDYAVEDSIAILTLDRPDAMNAFTPKMGEEVAAAFDMSDADPEVRAVIVTGAGKAFCAGADLSTGAETFNAVARAAETGEFDETDPRWRDTGGVMNLRIWASEKPVIAAINGAAVGIGATMILPMDARIAAAGAKMAYPFTKRGIAWDGCASWFLPRIVGIETALDWALSGRTFRAEEGLEKGLVSTVVPAGEVLEAAKAKAREFTEATAPVSVAMMRRMAWRMLTASHPMDAHRQETRAILHRGMSADAAEGVMSFLEKRAPAFPGRVPNDYPPGWPYDDEPGYEG